MEISYRKEDVIVLLPENREESDQIEEMWKEMNLGDQLYLEAIGSQKIDDITFPILEARNISDSCSFLITSSRFSALLGLNKLEGMCGDYLQFIWPEEQPNGFWGMVLHRSVGSGDQIKNEKEWIGSGLAD